MMRLLSTPFLATGLLLGLTWLARSQDPTQGNREPGSYDGILQFGIVQKELKLDDDQLLRVREVIHNVRQRHRGDLDKILALPHDQRRARWREVFQSISDETRHDLRSVLRPEQLKRLDQIHVQLEGIEAFSDPRVEKALRLTDDQRRQLQKIRDDAGRGFPGSGHGPLGETLKKMAASRKQRVQKAVALLTPDQKRTWKELTGEPFEVRIERPIFVRPRSEPKDAVPPRPD